MTAVDEIRVHAQTWHGVLHNVLVANDIRLVTYVPDNVLRPLIGAIHDDPFFDAFCVTREEEGLGIVSGTWLGGKRGVLLMQTSDFATLPNVLASLPVAFQIPVLLIVSERGTLGEFNLGQAMVCRTMRPVLELLGIEHHVCTGSTSWNSLQIGRSSRRWRPRPLRRLFFPRFLPVARSSHDEHQHAA